MARGGKREGAGRKAGVPNKITAETQAEVAKTGETPLDYMLRVMRDETADNGRRDAMAKAASPYVHPHLQAVQHTGEVTTRFVAEVPAKSETTEAWQSQHVPKPHRSK